MKLRNWQIPAESATDAITTEHLQLGLPPIEAEIIHPANHPILQIFAWLAGFMLLFICSFGIYKTVSASGSYTEFENIIISLLSNKIFWSAMLVGLLAQIIDGALGMAYGITSTSFLMLTGQPPVVASASVHIAEVFTTGASGLAHIKMQNVNHELFLKLLIPGIIGSVIGVLMITTIDSSVIKPFISVYLMIMGAYVISKAFRKIKPAKHKVKHVRKLALLGGWIDTVGGGGWGPVVTSTLLGNGNDPRTTIGSVNFAEFFLTFIAAFTFTIFIDEVPWAVVLGLIIGGIFAAPFAAILTRRVSAHILLYIVGGLIIIVSGVNLLRTYNIF